MSSVARGIEADKKTSSSSYQLIPRWLTADLCFFLLLAILIVSVAWSILGHRRSIAREMEYIPRDNTVVLVSGPIGSLWNAFDRQFGPVIHGTEGGLSREKKGVAKLLDNAQSGLKKKNITVKQLSDLARYGIDSSRGVFFAMHRTGSFVVVVPILTEPVFLETLRRLLSAKGIEAKPVPNVTPPLISSALKDFFVVFPEKGIAVISNNLEYLSRSVGARKANLEYSRNGDDLYDSLRHCVGGPLAVGPTIFIFGRPDEVPVPGIADAGIGLRFRKSDIALTAQLGVSSNRVQLVADLLDDAPSGVAWATRLPNQLAGSFAIHDKALGRILGTLGSTRLGDLLQDLYGGLLWSLRDSTALSHVVIAFTGYHAGLPQILTGLWGDQKELEAKFQDLRLRLRRERDLEILNGAKEAAPGSLTGFKTALLPEPSSTFDRYTMRSDGGFDGEPTINDLANETYTLQVEGHPIFFVAPRPTRNDKLFRKGFEKLTEAELADVKSIDRYRMAYVSHEGATWVATDVADLRALLSRTTDNVAGSPYFKSSTQDWSRRDKLEVFLNVDQITKLGLLSPESKIEDFVKNCLLDLRDNPVVVANLQKCAGRRECLSVSIRFIAREAIR